MDVALALIVILNAVKDLLYVFAPPGTDNKQILRCCAPQNDIVTSPQSDGRQARPQPNFRRRAQRRGAATKRIGISPAKAQGRKGKKVS
jgi:hypothetical protein